MYGLWWWTACLCSSVFPNQRVSKCEDDGCFYTRRSLCCLIRCSGLLSSGVTPDLYWLTGTDGASIVSLGVCMVMWTEFHPSTAPVTWLRWQPQPKLHLLCAIWGLITFLGFVFLHPPSHKHAIPLHYAYINKHRHKFSPFGAQNLFNTCSCRDADGPQETAGDVRLLALSCCLQVKFTKSKWPVCFSLIEGLCWVLWDVSREDTVMTELCRKSFAPGSVY